MNTKLLEAIYESALDGEITAEQCQAMEDILMTESVPDKVSKVKKKLDSVVALNSDEYVTKYIKDNYDEFVKGVEILEKEPSQFTSSQIKTLNKMNKIAMVSLLLSIPTFGISTFVGMIYDVYVWIVSSLSNKQRLKDNKEIYQSLCDVENNLNKIISSKKLDKDNNEKFESLIKKIQMAKKEYEKDIDDVDK